MQHSEAFYWGLIGLEFSICLFLYILSIWRLIPLGLTAYTCWNKSQKTKDLAHTVICFMFALCFLLFISVVIINTVFLSDEIFSRAYGLVRLILILVLTYFIGYFSVPKTLKFYTKWKETKQTKYFSRLTSAGTLSLYAFLIILTLCLPSKIGF